MKPNRVGQRFWVPHSSHCVTISALPAPPHFSCQEGQQKGGGWGDEGEQGGTRGDGQKIFWLIALHTGWQGPCQQRQIEKPVSLQQIVICFSIWKNLLFFVLGEKLVLVPRQFFQISKVKKLGLGSHVLQAEALLAGINIMRWWWGGKNGRHG